MFIVRYLLKLIVTQYKSLVNSCIFIVMLCVKVSELIFNHCKLTVSFTFRLTVNQNSFLAPRTKTVNLDVLNVSTDSLPPKKDNLGSLKNLNITNEGTLQKIKKTYI